MQKPYTVFLTPKYTLLEVFFISTVTYLAMDYTWWALLLLVPLQAIHLILQIYFRPKGFL